MRSHRAVCFASALPTLRLDSRFRGNDRGGVGENLLLGSGVSPVCLPSPKSGGSRGLREMSHSLGVSDG